MANKFKWNSTTNVRIFYSIDYTTHSRGAICDDDDVDDDKSPTSLKDIHSSNFFGNTRRESTGFVGLIDRDMNSIPVFVDMLVSCSVI